MVGRRVAFATDRLHPPGANVTFSADLIASSGRV